MADWLPVLVLLPLLWACLAFWSGPGQGAALALAGLTLQCLLAAGLAWELPARGAQFYPVGGWGAPLGIDLRFDGLAGLMVLLTQTVTLALAAYARAYFHTHPEGGRYFWPLLGFLLAGMNALFLAADLFNIYVTLELLGLAAVGLVAVEGRVPALTAALRYLLITLLGSGLYLLGVALIYGSYGSLAMAILQPLVADSAPLAVQLAAGMMLLGMLLKTALFPFHFWLPPAHGGAPAPVSALLSALVIKASFYLILRLWFGLFLPLTTPEVALLLGGLGALAIVWGSWRAFVQPRLKMLIAYSTVAQLGYLFLLFPLTSQGSSLAAQSAFQGGMLQLVAHALAKSAMFAASGVVVLALGSDRIATLAGLAGRLPLTLFTFALGGVTLMGLPPSGGFLAKWLLLRGALGSGQWGWALVMIGGGLLTAAYLFKVLRVAFLEAPDLPKMRPPAAVLEWSALLLALGSLLLGLHASELLALLEVT